eukprot:1157256-Pelagomonas_calceolata.AAC.9
MQLERTSGVGSWDLIFESLSKPEPEVQHLSTQPVPHRGEAQKRTCELYALKGHCLARPSASSPTVRRRSYQDANACGWANVTTQDAWNPLKHLKYALPASPAEMEKQQICRARILVAAPRLALTPTWK